MLTPEIFYSYHVKRKIEPHVYSSWAKKLNSKNKEKKRFIVATQSALYILKRTVIGKNLKISNILPWVNLTNLVASNPGNLQFTFGQRKVCIQLQNLEDATTRIVSYLKSLFPSSYSLSIETPFKISPRKRRREKSYLMSLFVSYCHSLQLPVHEPIIKALIQQSKDHPNYIDLTTIPIDQKMYPPLTSALKLTTNIESIKVDCTKFQHPLATLLEIISANESITTVKIKSIKKFNHFDMFTTGLPNTKTVNLSFSKCQFDDQVFSLLLQSPAASTFKSLQFNQCSITSSMIHQLIRSQGQLSSLNHFKLKNNLNILSPNLTRSLFKYVSDHNIKTLELVNVGIDISLIFENIHNLPFLKHLNISKNLSKEFIKSFCFPNTLNIINMSGITWTAYNMISLCTQFRYNRSSTVDFSNANLSQEEWNVVFDECANSEPPTSSNITFYWQSNPIDSRFFTFLIKFGTIEKLFLDYCRYSDERSHSILNSMIILIQRHNILSLSMKGYSKRRNALVINELFPIFQQRDCLEYLDVSDNNIGNNGLESLVKLLNTSKKLKTLKFDGSNPSKVSSLTKLLKTISQSDVLQDVSEPIHDIKRMLSKFPAMRETLNVSWYMCKKKFLRNIKKDKKEENESDGLIDVSSEPTSFSNSYASNFDSYRSETELEASWDITIGLPINTGLAEWESLKNQFSLSKLTNVEI